MLSESSIESLIASDEPLLTWKGRQRKNSRVRVLQQLLDEQRHAHGCQAADGRVVAAKLGNGAAETRQHGVPPAAHA